MHSRPEAASNSLKWCSKAEISKGCCLKAFKYSKVSTHNPSETHCVYKYNYVDGSIFSKNISQLGCFFQKETTTNQMK